MTINFFFKTFTKKSGTLIPFSLINNVPFKKKRIFLIYLKKNYDENNKPLY